MCEPHHHQSLGHGGRGVSWRIGRRVVTCCLLYMVCYNNHELTAAVVACTRPIQDQAKPSPSIDRVDDLSSTLYTVNMCCSIG